MPHLILKLPSRASTLDIVSVLAASMIGFLLWCFASHGTRRLQGIGQGCRGRF